LARVGGLGGAGAVRADGIVAGVTTRAFKRRSFASTCHTSIFFSAPIFIITARAVVHVRLGALCVCTDGFLTGVGRGGTLIVRFTNAGVLSRANTFSVAHVVFCACLSVIAFLAHSRFIGADALRVTGTHKTWVIRDTFAVVSLAKHLIVNAAL